MRFSGEAIFGVYKTLIISTIVDVWAILLLYLVYKTLIISTIVDLAPHICTAKESIRHL